MLNFLDSYFFFCAPTDIYLSYPWKIHSVVQYCCFRYDSILLMLGLVCTIFPFSSAHICRNKSFVHILLHCILHIAHCECAVYYAVSTFQVPGSDAIHWMHKSKPTIWGFWVFWHLFEMKGTMNANRKTVPRHQERKTNIVMLQIESDFSNEVNWKLDMINKIWLSFSRYFGFYRLVKMFSVVVSFAIASNFQNYYLKQMQIKRKKEKKSATTVMIATLHVLISRDSVFGEYLCKCHRSLFVRPFKFQFFFFFYWVISVMHGAYISVG